MSRGLVLSPLLLVVFLQLAWSNEEFYPKKDEIKSYAAVQSPFRMQKTNLGKYSWFYYSSIKL